MKHVVVQVSDSGTFGGTERVILQLLERLDRDRWVTVLLHPGSEGAMPLVERARALGVEHQALDIPAGAARMQRISSLVRQLRSLNPSVVHVHLPTPASCTHLLIAAAVARVPAVVATAHLHLDVSPFKARIKHRLLTSCVHRYLAVSDDIGWKLRHALLVPAHKIRLVRNAVPPMDFAAPPPSRLRYELMAGSRTRMALVVARLNEQKGHRYLLEAAAQMPDTTFVLAGEGPAREALQQQARDLDISARVRFLGYRTDVAALLAVCDVLVLPSLFEGLPLAVLEAMAAGKPVVATSISGTREAVVHNETGLLVPPADPAALAAAVRTVLDHPDLARRFGMNGQARARAHFRVEIMVGQVAAIYDELLA